MEKASSGKEVIITTEKMVAVSYDRYQFLGAAVRALFKCLGVGDSSTSTTQQVHIDFSVEGTPATSATAAAEQVVPPPEAVVAPEADPAAASNAPKRPRITLRAARPEISTGSGAQTN
uniref:PROPEP2 n=1 Tax=Prunus mume TaxID=102107 RepID=A0A823ABJ1_PRUMU|nr:TPA_inf: PROPEP2 [Prunus mume]